MGLVVANCLRVLKIPLGPNPRAPIPAVGAGADPGVVALPDPLPQPAAASAPTTAGAGRSGRLAWPGFGILCAGKKAGGARSRAATQRAALQVAAARGQRGGPGLNEGPIADTVAL